ncbi:unnamed protein product, partial [Durusdinium trenchii]
DSTVEPFYEELFKFWNVRLRRASEPSPSTVVEVEDSDAEDDLCHWVVKSDPYPSSPVKMAAEAGAPVEHSLQGAITDSGASVLEEPLIAKEEGAMRDQLKTEVDSGEATKKVSTQKGFK